MTFLNHADRTAARRTPPQASAEPETLHLQFLPRAEIDACETYRDACALAWRRRTRPGLTTTALAVEAELIQQHVSEYFHPKERDERGRKRRQLPADKVGRVQQELGNCAIAQWLARDMALRLVEEFFAAESVR